MNKYDIDFRFPTYPSCSRQKIWTCLRKSGEPLKLKDILRICGVREQSTKHYINALCRMGYVMVSGCRYASPAVGTNALYRIVKDTGPLYPVERKAGHIYFDQNTGEIWSDTFSEEEMLALMRKAAKRKQAASTYQKTTDRPGWKKTFRDDDE